MSHRRRFKEFDLWCGVFGIAVIQWGKRAKLSLHTKACCVVQPLEPWSGSPTWDNNWIERIVLPCQIVNVIYCFVFYERWQAALWRHNTKTSLIPSEQTQGASFTLLQDTVPSKWLWSAELRSSGWENKGVILDTAQKNHQTENLKPGILVAILLKTYSNH